jgi:hypothetical protein
LYINQNWRFASGQIPGGDRDIPNLLQHQPPHSPGTAQDFSASCSAIPSPENFLAEGCENFLDRGGLRLGILVVEGRSLKMSITEAKDHGLNKIQNLAGG